MSLKEPADVARVVIYTPNLRDYDLQFRGPEGQLHVAEIRGNQETVIEHNFEPAIPCLKLRITALAAREVSLPVNSAPQVAEIEAYETPGEGPPTPVETRARATAIPEGVIPLADTAGADALWRDDFTAFESRDKYYWDGQDTKWVFDPQKFQATPRAGGGIVCTTIAEKGGSGMSHIFPYDPAIIFF